MTKDERIVAIQSAVYFETAIDWREASHIAEILYKKLFSCTHESISALKLTPEKWPTITGKCDDCGEMIDVYAGKDVLDIAGKIHFHTEVCKHVVKNLCSSCRKPHGRCVKCGEWVSPPIGKPAKLDMPEELTPRGGPLMGQADINRRNINKIIRIIKKNVEEGRLRL